jgi:hypothetical protein
MRSRSAHCERTVDSYTLFPLVCVGYSSMLFYLKAAIHERDFLKVQAVRNSATYVVASLRPNFLSVACVYCIGDSRP